MLADATCVVVGLVVGDVVGVVAPVEAELETSLRERGAGDRFVEVVIRPKKNAPTPTTSTAAITTILRFIMSLFPIGFRCKLGMLSIPYPLPVNPVALYQCV